MKSSVAISLLFLLPSIHAAALPQLVGDELESTSSSQKRDASGNLAPRSPKPGFLNEDSEHEYLPEAAASRTDDPSLDPSLNLKRDLTARSPQGPASNPGEFTGVGLSRVNPANHDLSTDSSSSSSSVDNGQDFYTIKGGFGHSVDSSKMAHDGAPRKDHMMGDDAKMEYHRHHNGTHHRWNGTHHEHRKDGILAEYDSHGEHIVVYNGTQYPNGTNYNPANETMDGGKMIAEVIIDGDEVVVYHQLWNETHHHHHNHTGGPMPTATGLWLPSGTGWIPSATGAPHHHRKVPSAAYAGYRGPKSKRDGKVSKDDEYSVGGFKYGK
ncbi:MAG: hypothetical protein ASARMPRED_001318 [Alectoria sarmentosa]|nr:MAG: hypothetical protein ASARMPRED_001318 [Alectoria sarmentosa]